MLFLSVAGTPHPRLLSFWAKTFRMAFIGHGGGMVYARDSKSRSRKGLRVQVPPMAPLPMISPDLDYLRRIAGATLAELLREQKFLDAQKLFFLVVTSLGGSVDFEIADMREVHAVAALGDVKHLKVLDVGCGSLGTYVLEDTFRDRYPPFFAEMLARLGADVTGTDIRPNPRAGYRHLTLDCTKEHWMKSFRAPYDVIACLNIFNAPKSPFEHDATLCDRLMDDMRSVLSPQGILIVTLRDDLFTNDTETMQDVEDYVASKCFMLLHLDGNCAWLQHASII